MDKEDPLLGLKNKVEKELNEFFNNKIKQSKKQNKPKEFLEMIENSKRFVLNGGKRIRPILFYYGYLLAGGDREEDVLKTSISIELIHFYLLIHDDIIDRDDLRHNDLSMHCRYEKEYKVYLQEQHTNKLFSLISENNSKYFGVSMAVIVGDLVSSLGYEVLIHSNFSSDLKIKAIEKLNRIVSNTITGEAMDVNLANRLDADVNDIIKMQEYKTARYTIEGPLHLGAILAGANEEFLESISEFAIPLGISFQIQDDIIGVFGNEKKIGKPVGADIKEGKKTFLSIKAFEKADQKQLKILSELFGNKNINLNEINAVRKIIEETGSLEYSLRKIKDLTKLSKTKLEKMEISEKNKEFLLGLADFMVERKK